MRGMIAYIPLYVNLTSTQGCIRGLAHACVCVCMEESKEEGDVRGECAPDEGFDDGEREVGRILNPSF